MFPFFLNILVMSSWLLIAFKFDIPLRMLICHLQPARQLLWRDTATRCLSHTIWQTSERQTTRHGLTAGLTVKFVHGLSFVFIKNIHKIDAEHFLWGTNPPLFESKHGNWSVQGKWLNSSSPDRYNLQQTTFFMANLTHWHTACATAWLIGLTHK